MRRIFLSSACAQTPPNEPVLAPITATGFPERGGAARARGPVDRVLQLARHRGVVLRRGDQHGVGAGDRVTKPLDSRVGLLAVVVLVIGRHGLQPPVELELDAGGQELGGLEQEPAVVRVTPQAPGDPEDAHLVTPAPSRARGRRQRDLVLEDRAAAGKLHVPVHPEGRPVDDGLEGEADLLAGGAGDGAGDRAGQRDGLLRAAELQLALDDELVAVAADVGGRERDAREALGVEEVGREQVALEVLVLDGDAGDVGRAAQRAVGEVAAKR